MTIPPPDPLDVNRFHLTSDYDSSPEAIHHSLGPEPFQAAPGNHSHFQNLSQILGVIYPPGFRRATLSIQVTWGSPTSTGTRQLFLSDNSLGYTWAVGVFNYSTGVSSVLITTLSVPVSQKGGSWTINVPTGATYTITGVYDAS